MDALAYLHLQMRLEGNMVIKGCLIRQAEVVPGEEPPLLLIARLASEEVVIYYNEFISPILHRQLKAQTFRFPQITGLIDILASHHIPFEVGHYKTYVFSGKPAKSADVLCLPKHDLRIKAFGFDELMQDVYAIERNDTVISACVSTRENDQCGEAWVYTAPEYRNQGFAQKVVNTWAASLMDAGKVPFYSHKVENEASARLASRLGLQQVFEEIAITQSHSFSVIASPAG